MHCAVVWDVHQFKLFFIHKFHVKYDANISIQIHYFYIVRTYVQGEL